MLEVFSFCNQERPQPPLLKITVLTFLVKNSKMKLFLGVHFLRMCKKSLSQLSRTSSRSYPQI